MHGSPHIVSDAMTRTVVAVGRDATFEEIVSTTEQWKVSALPVLGGESRVIGVVSEAICSPRRNEYRDSGPSRPEQLRRPAALGKAGAVTAEELMSAPAVCVHPDATLSQTARAMAQHTIKRLSVIDSEGRLCGIVSRGRTRRSRRRRAARSSPTFSPATAPRPGGPFGLCPADASRKDAGPRYTVCGGRWPEWP
ncbi:CBS domain-containing protein [Actinacidiphila soli]|uniref:CBS domain-containing protein n=1 Tax=Actinacidiphila soli TaxID=2487275 RepID=UPI002AFE6759|nr:CBS domain-containing protein [Actinacidiphila soli]